MDKKPVVMQKSEMIDAARAFLDKLDDAKVPVRSFFWYLEPEVQEWRLFVASPWVDNRGPAQFHSALDKLLKALPQSGTIEYALTTASPSSALIEGLSREKSFVTSPTSSTPVVFDDAIVYRLVPGKTRR